MPKVSLKELAHLVGGRVVGDSEVAVVNALPLQDADADCITLADSPEQLGKANQSKAAAVVVRKPTEPCAKPLVVVDDIHAAFIQIINRLRPGSTDRGNVVDAGVMVSGQSEVDDSASIGAGTKVAAGVTIAAGCSVGDRCVIHPGVTLMEGCRVGNDCELFPGCVLYPGTILGDRVLVHANATIGAFGFGYRLENGRHCRTAQLGWVEVGNDVEIGANTNIDRGTYGPTRIGDGTKIDNLVQIAHNCHIGRHNLICSQVGIAGSCSTGDYVVMGGQVGMADHLKVGDRAMVSARSGLMYDVPDNEIVFGSPAGPRKDKLREQILITRLPDLKRDLQKLARRIVELEAKQSFLEPTESIASEASEDGPGGAKEQISDSGRHAA